MPKTTISAMETKIGEDPRMKEGFISNKLRDLFQQNASSPMPKNNDFQQISNNTEAMWNQQLWNN